MESTDIRWEQRFVNYKRALLKFSQAVEYINQNFVGVVDDIKNHLDTSQTILNDVLKEGIIQRFEYTHELAWNLMKDYAEYQGNANIRGSRDATREAYKMGIISKSEIWMDMIQSRNLTSHTYNQETADEIYLKIVNNYYPAFNDLSIIMEELSE